MGLLLSLSLQSHYSGVSITVLETQITVQEILILNPIPGVGLTQSHHKNIIVKFSKSLDVTLTSLRKIDFNLSLSLI